MGGPLIQGCEVENQSGEPFRACRSGHGSMIRGSQSFVISFKWWHDLGCCFVILRPRA